MTESDSLADHSEWRTPLAIEGRMEESFERKRQRAKAMIQRILDRTDLTTIIWQGEGVQVAFVEDAQENERLALVRSETEPDGPIRTFTSGEWDAFIEGVRLGEFDNI